MVLESFEPLKDTHGVSSSGGSMMRRSSTCSSGSTGGVSCLNLSSLTLSEGHQSGSHLSSFMNSTVSSSTSTNTLVNQSPSMMKRGWGSAETRRASTSLSTMAGTAEGHSSKNGWVGGAAAACVNPGMHTAVSNSTDKDGWGYFVDVMEDDDEDVLMW